jgi:hypothetical protein
MLETSMTSVTWHLACSISLREHNETGCLGSHGCIVTEKADEGFYIYFETTDGEMLRQVQVTSKMSFPGAISKVLVTL